MALAVPLGEQGDAHGPAPAPAVAGRRGRLRTPAGRFGLAALVGVLLVSPAYLWVSCNLWTGRWDLFRYLPYEANFYDLQARAMLHGHLWLQTGSIGIEAFDHGGHQYTYFGLFPSLIRIPVLLVTSRLDSRLTVPSMVLAWAVTAVCSSMLVWRVRCWLRGDAALGRAETVSLGALVATICGGTVLVTLAATPFVFDEDLTWSVALTVASLLVLLGLVERPSRRRVVWCGLLVLAANLDRVTTGTGCALAVLLVAGWFALGRAGAEHRRLALWLATAGALPLLVAAAINWAKFGQLVGLPMQDQVFSQINAYRKQFLAVNGGETGIQFVPSTALAYLRPDGLRIGSTFPFVTAPTSPAAVVGHILFDRVYPTPSVTATMPLLFLLACWGTATCFLRRRDPRTRLLSLLLVGAGTSAAAILGWGYIADRYLGDFVPLLVLGGAVGAVLCWRALEGRGVRLRRAVLACFVVLAVVEIAVNVALAIAPNDEWNTAQLARFVSAEASVGALGGPSLAGQVAHGSQLPQWAPAGTLFDVGRCEGLYVSDGEDVATVPLEVYQHATWLPAEEGVPYQHLVRLTLPADLPAGSGGAPILRSGPTTVSVRVRSDGAGQPLSLWFVVQDPAYPVSSGYDRVAAGASITVDLVSDLQLHQLILTIGGSPYLDGVFTGGTTATVPASTSPAVSVADVTDPSAEDALCRRVTGGSGS